MLIMNEITPVISLCLSNPSCEWGKCSTSCSWNGMRWGWKGVSGRASRWSTCLEIQSKTRQREGATGEPPQVSPHSVKRPLSLSFGSGWSSSKVPYTAPSQGGERAPPTRRGREAAKTPSESEILGKQPCDSHHHKALAAFVCAQPLPVFSPQSSEQPCHGHCYAKTQMTLWEAKKDLFKGTAYKSQSQRLSLDLSDSKDGAWNHYEKEGGGRKLVPGSQMPWTRLVAF
jgi:hypothetical protein